MARMDQGRPWIETLPEQTLGRQRRILENLLDFAEQDADSRWLAVSCSLARGAADTLSDVDAGLGVADGAVEAAATRVAEHVLASTPVADMLRHGWNGSGGRPAVRLFVQFGDRTQLDLVVVEAATRPGRAPDEVVLYDVEDRLATQFVPSPDIVGAEQVRQWAFLAWIALADMAKYLSRGSLWEAHARLHEARDRVWALWAAVRGARYPVFGLSQVLDHDPGDLPPGIERTVSDLDPRRLREAGAACAEVLDTVSRTAAEKFGAETPIAMARHVSGLLLDL